MCTTAYNVDVASDRRRRKNMQDTFFVLIKFNNKTKNINKNTEYNKNLKK